MGCGKRLSICYNIFSNVCFLVFSCQPKISGRVASVPAKTRSINVVVSQGLTKNQHVKGFFNETRVKLSDDVAKMIEQNSELKIILDVEDVELEKGMLHGTWNMEQCLCSFYPFCMVLIFMKINEKAIIH